MIYKIRISFDKKQPANLGLSLHLRRCITQALRFQGVDVPCEINVLVTDNQGIRAINAASRQIDQATDVLSFPMFSLTPGQLPEDWSDYVDPETGRVPLGDMCIALERAEEQALEYGHSVEREVCYLAVHSVLHLLGYDHEAGGLEAVRMREKEEAVLIQLGLPRTVSYTSDEI